MSLFWDEPLASKRHARIRVPPPVPDTGWRVPTEFPNLDAATIIAVDTETKEFDFDNGPGWARQQGHIVGVSLAAQDRRGNRGSWYFPVRHEVGTEDNMDSRNVFGFCKHVLENPNTRKIGANLTYDLGHLSEEKIFVQGPLDDVQFGEALLDSEARVALDILSHKYIGRGKTTDVMYNWMREAYPNTPETKRRGDIYRTPPRLVGYYAEDDANNPIDIWYKQAPLLVREKLDYVYRLECDLIPMMIAMRRAGVRVDLDKAEILHRRLRSEIAENYAKLYEDFGIRLESMDSRQLGPALELLQISVPRNEPTAKQIAAAQLNGSDVPEGGYSVTKEWLAGLEHPIGDALNEIREKEKICGTFLEGYVFKKNVGGFLFPQFHQMKNDENGTVVGRFASSTPNLQNIPSRTVLGKLVRDCFVPDEGHSHWQKNDYSQVHYRILAHYAVGPGADGLRDAYLTNPKMDYHDNVYFNVCPLLGWDAEDEDLMAFRRRPIKNVNFGLLYGQSVKALMYKTAMYFGEGFGQAEGEAFFKAYFEGAPYVKPTMEFIGKEVQKNGYVETLLGRRIRFHEWEPAGRGVKASPLHYDDAIRQWGPNIRRAYEYRGVNYKFQGSEPDIMKHGMRQLWQSGVFNYIGVPRLTVHDELDFSIREGESYVEKNKKGVEVTKYRATGAMREALDFVKYTMQNTLKLRVPLRVDESSGPSWGKAD